MKKFPISILLMALFFGAAQITNAQSKDEKTVVERTYLLSHTVFGTKDSLTLEDLFAKVSTYGHSGGKVQTRAEAIAGTSGNKSTYTDTSIANVNTILQGNTAVVRYLFKANEHTVDGKTVPLNFSMLLVWVKEKGKWRLMGRQAVKLV